MATGRCASPALDLLSLAHQAPYCLLPQSLRFLHCRDTPQSATARDPPSRPTVSLPDLSTFPPIVCLHCKGLFQYLTLGSLLSLSFLNSNAYK